MNKLHLADCMDGMKQFPDKYFDLAIVDPPYGFGQSVNFRFDKIYDNEKPPTKEYFDELFRVSKDQIIWGGNYFTFALEPRLAWLCWDKGQPLDNFSDFELAWTSFNSVAKMVRLPSYGFNHADKRIGKESTIHPTQKPVSLYGWLLRNYTTPDMKIIDTHVGSGSSIIAFIDFGCEWIGFEIDPEYHQAASKRIQQHTSQTKLQF